MQRTFILDLLNKYKTADRAEKAMRRDMIDFIERHPDCFERSLLKGHVTGSAWIVNPARTHALLIHHVKLDKWMQPGGHCDGDPDVLSVAMKEAYEETGLTVEPLQTTVFDVDNHHIPPKKDLPGHIHYDVRFLFTAKKGAEELPGNSEVNTIRWIKLEEVVRFNDSESVMRMVRKTSTDLT